MGKSKNIFTKLKNKNILEFQKNFTDAGKNIMKIMSQFRKLNQYAKNQFVTHHKWVARDSSDWSKIS